MRKNWITLRTRATRTNVSNITSEALSSVLTRVCVSRRRVALSASFILVFDSFPAPRSEHPSRQPCCFPSPDGLIHNLCTTATRSPPLASSSLPVARRRVGQVCTCVDEPNLTVFPRGGSSLPRQVQNLTVKRSTVKRRARVVPRPATSDYRPRLSNRDSKLSEESGEKLTSR